MTNRIRGAIAGVLLAAAGAAQAEVVTLEWATDVLLSYEETASECAAGDEAACDRFERGADALAVLGDQVLGGKLPVAHEADRHDLTEQFLDTWRNIESLMQGGAAPAGAADEDEEPDC